MEQITKEITGLVEKQDVERLCRVLFDLELAPGQIQIVKQTVWGPRRVCVKCPTRYGKTWAVAAGISLYILLNDGHTVTILSNKKDNTKNIRDQMIEHAGKCPPLMSLLSGRASNKVERVKESLSKEKMKLVDGTKVNMQAAGQNVSPEQLDGLGGDLIVLDEADNVPEENYNRGVRRMMGDSPDTRLVMSGNNTVDKQHWIDAFQDEKFERIQISWEQAVKETYGRTGVRPLTREYVEGERDELPPSLFKQLYESEFPDSTDDSLIAYKYLKGARRSLDGDDLVEDPGVVYGLDVAREGRDHSVLTRVEKHGAYYKVTSQWDFDIPNSDVLADKVQSIVDERDGDGYMSVNVDSHGMGGPVRDRLVSLGIYARGIKVGVSRKKALRRPDDFKNLKAEYYDRVRQLFSNESIVFSERFPRMTKELNSLETSSTTNNKIKVENSLGKSPDYADSLMLALAVVKPRREQKSGSFTF